MSDGLVALQAQLTEALAKAFHAEHERLARRQEPCVQDWDKARALMQWRLNPVVDHFRAAERQAGRREGLAEAIVAVKKDCSHSDMHYGDFNPATCPICTPRAAAIAALVSSLKVEVTVGADKERVDDVLELDDQTLIHGRTRHAAFQSWINAQLGSL